MRPSTIRGAGQKPVLSKTEQQIHHGKTQCLENFELRSAIIQYFSLPYQKLKTSCEIDRLYYC